MKKSVKDQTVGAFQVGGYVPPSVPQQPYNQPTQVNPQTGTYTLPGTGIAGYQVPSGAPTGYTPYGGATPYFQPVQFTGAQYQTALQTTNLPTFAETVGSKPGQYDELRTHINDAGQTLQIPFKDGKPIYPVPEGYRPIGDQPAPEEDTPTTVTPTLGQAQVRDDSGGRDDELSKTSTGGGVSVKTTTGGSFTTPTLEQNVSKYGYTGKQGMNVATALAVGTGNILGALGSVSGFMPEKIGSVPTELFAEPARPGMTGTIDNSILEAIAAGTYSLEDFRENKIGVNQQMAKDILDMQSIIGTNLTGITGYKPGDLNPVTGSFVNQYGAALDGFVTRNHSYTSIKSMIDTVTRGNASGWRGGYVSPEVYKDVLTDAQKKNYDKFDSTHRNREDESRVDAGLTGPGRGVEDMSRSEIAEERAAIESMTSGRGIPDNVQAEIDAALEAAGRPDLTSGNIGRESPGSDDDDDDGPGNGSSGSSGGGHGSMGGGAPGSTGGYGGGFR